MGNAPSSEPPAQREAHRLTKPRTYNHTPSPKLGSPASSSKLSNLDTNEVMWTSGGSFRSKQEARQQIRMRLFGPQEEEALFQRETTPQSDDGEVSLGDLAQNLNEQLNSISRSGSLVSEPGPQRTSTMKSSSQFGGSKVSLVPEKRAIDIDAAISILQELKKTATTDQLVALRTSPC